MVKTTLETQCAKSPYRNQLFQKSFSVSIFLGCYQICAFYASIRSSMSNFAFLGAYWPDFAKTMEFAERYAYTDPASSKNKSGLFVELMTREILRIENIAEPATDNTHFNRIKILEYENLLPHDVTRWINQVRKSRNDSAHENCASAKDALCVLSFTFHIAVWFMQVYGDGAFEPEEFIPPEPPKKIPDYTRLVLNQEKKIEEQNKIITDKDAELQAIHAALAEREKRLQALEAEIEKARNARATASALTPQSVRSKQERQNTSAQALAKTKLTEAETRALIDEQLRKVGWEADTTNLRYSKGTRPERGKKRAIAEWPVKSATQNENYADYALFYGEQLIGLIEAKAYKKNIYAVIDNQCREYAKNIRDEDEKYCVGKWQDYKVPFVFATNGRPYLKQIETESGIWFHDLRKPSHIPQALHGWYSPESLLAKQNQNIDRANAGLSNLPYDFLRDPDGLNLRNYQLEAVAAVEKAVISGQSRILLAMATGTGKTRTILAMIYRFFLKARFRRVLFLVDRTALGEQAQDVFSAVKLEALKTLDKLYTINTLHETDLEKETRIHIATVQGMVHRIMNEDKDTIPSSGDFDCIIIDEAHRGYTLDRELSEAEFLYRSQDDFISKYKKVIEYFDAVKIALTATPALHTTQIFGNPVYTYSYREAVIDGYLADHDAPYNIKTELNQHGIHHAKGECLARFNPITKELLNPEELEDDIDFEVEEFNKKVLTEAFNKTVLTELSNHIDPEGAEKTLIFAVNQSHASLIAKLLRKIYEKQEIPAEAIEQITGSIDGGPQRVKEAIKKFKNEHYPTIAVTVDLLSTGIDVPEITKIVFMRRIKSRILYEQMLGRATRLCPKINKTHFDIFDAVNLYAYLDDFSSMKSVVVNPSASFDELLAGYEKVDDEAHIQFINEQVIAKFQRMKRNLDENRLQQFNALTHSDSLESFIATIRNAKAESEDKCKELLILAREALKLLEQRNEAQYAIISDKSDRVIQVSRGFGAGQAPADYLESFEIYLKTNRTKIEALEIICTRPADLTLKDLRNVSMTLDAHGFNSMQLNTAITQLTNEECAADIITLVRCYAIGSPIVSHEERIRNAVKKLCKAHNFTAIEKKWIDRIEKYLINESILNAKTFDEFPAWKNQGGFSKVDKIFGSTLHSIIRELNTYLYEDKSA